MEIVSIQSITNSLKYQIEIGCPMNAKTLSVGCSSNYSDILLKFGDHMLICQPSVSNYYGQSSKSKDGSC